MLELIFQGFVEWAYGMTLECWQYFSSVLLDIMSMDFAYLRTHMPVIDTIEQSMLAIGWALLIGNLLFQAIKTMLSGIGFEGEDPKLLFTRTFVFAFLLLASPQICEICLNITSRAIEVMEIPDAVNITFADEASFDGLVAAWILVVISGVIVMFQSFRLIFEMAERYVVLAVLTITAPLAFGMGGSRNTSDIFGGWCRMYGSMCLLMVMNVVFIKMLLSVLSFYPSGLDVLPWMVLVFAVVKVAKKIDSIITRIGLSPAITGDSLGRTFPGSLSYMVIRTATAQIGKAIQKSSGQSGRGQSPHVPPSGTGGPRSGGPKSGGPTSSFRYTANEDTSSKGGATTESSSGHTEQDAQRSAYQYSAYQHSGNQQHTAYRQETGVSPGTVQGQPIHTAEPKQGGTSQQSVGTSTTVNSQVNQSGQAVRQERKTSVPSGTRRAPSYVTSVPTGGFTGTGHDGTGSSSCVHEGRASDPATRPRGIASTPNTGSGGTRFTQVASQQVQGGAAASNVQATEQTHISIGRTQPSPMPSAGKAPSVGPAPGVNITRGDNPQASTPPGAGPARSTHRLPTAASDKSTSGSAATPVSGKVGTISSSSTPLAEQARHGRNAVPPSGAAAAVSQTGQSTTVRQELQGAPGRTAVPARSIASTPAAGTAGTAPAGQRTSQTRQTARKQSARAKSTPTATDSLGPKRAASAATAQQKKLTTRKTAVKPPQHDRESDHGK